MKSISFVGLMLVVLAGCDKDNDQFATGTVMQAAGCYPDSWLIAVDNPDPRHHDFIRPTSFSTATLFNCSNAVFIRLTSAFAKPGSKIRFVAGEIELSCLSYSEAPNHIKVK